MECQSSLQTSSNKYFKSLWWRCCEWCRQFRRWGQRWHDRVLQSWTCKLRLTEEVYRKERLKPRRNRQKTFRDLLGGPILAVGKDGQAALDFKTTLDLACTNKLKCVGRF